MVKEFYNDVGEKNFYIHEICDENGNYIQLENGIVTVKEKVAPARPNPKSAASATYEGNIPKMTVSHSSTGVNENSERKSEREIPLEDWPKGDTLLDAIKNRKTSTEHKWTSNMPAPSNGQNLSDTNVAQHEAQSQDKNLSATSSWKRSPALSSRSKS